MIGSRKRRGKCFPYPKFESELFLNPQISKLWEKAKIVEVTFCEPKYYAAG